MTFDQYGYLTPHELIETDFDTFEQIFVTEFPHSETRGVIFEQYVQYLDELRQIVGAGFYQWIDGSFITQKLNPNDIDFVSFIDASLIVQYDNDLNVLRKKRYQKERYLDNYFVGTYPIDSPQYSIFKMDSLAWLELFEKDNRKRLPLKKGFIQLNF